MMASLPRFAFNRTFAFGAALFVLAMGLAIGLISDGAYRAQKERETRIDAQTLAASVVAPLMFADSATAQEYVSALAANPEIAAVGVYDARDVLVASYGERLERLATDGEKGFAYRGALLQTSAPVARDGTGYGVVVLQVRTDTLATRMVRHAPIGMLVLMAALVLFVAGAAQGELRRATQALSDA